MEGKIIYGELDRIGIYPGICLLKQIKAMKTSNLGILQKLVTYQHHNPSEC
jgi:hypothetical protein